MYDLLDRPVADLPAPDYRLLAATRGWVHQLTMAGTASAAAAGSMGAASDAFDAAMRALDEGSSDTLVFERPCHASVNEIEAVLLGIWRLVRADRVGRARDALNGLVAEASASVVLAAMMRVAAKG